MSEKYIKEFSEIEFKDAYKAGNTNYFLGKAYKYLKNKGINIPDGFIIGPEGFEWFLKENHIKKNLSDLCRKLDKDRFGNLKEISLRARALILSAEMPEILRTEIVVAREKLLSNIHAALRLAVRCSVVDGHFSKGHFNNLNDLIFNISSEEELIKSCIKCYASLYSEKEIKYREEKGIDHSQVSMAVSIQKMVRSDLACSGLMADIEPDNGEGQKIRIEGCWGMIENLKSGLTAPDAFYVSYGIEGEPLIVSKTLGEKDKTLIYYDLPDQNKEATFINIRTLQSKRARFVLNDEELLTLASWSRVIHTYFKEPMQIGWAKDGLSNELYIIYANPVSSK